MIVNRTTEYRKLTKNSVELQTNNSYTDIINLLLTLKENFKILDKTSLYETYKIDPLVRNITQELDKLAKIEIKEIDENNKNIKSFINRKILEYNLKLKTVKKKITRNSQLLIEEEIKTKHPNQEQYEESTLIRGSKGISKEMIRERKRIVNTITEIGNVLEDINIHVSLQEEKFKRIDDIIVNTESYSKRIIKDLGVIWNLISTRRQGFNIFFIFWFLIIILIYFSKKH
ncbi:hypothetical protein HERIO_794 [Hepatospora eriocheir]|uniref:t-SNARE coiled-coil homology domain-containing protein n=1 Tax=Hepatospora eriocheir TaxID=1081669 RepID=A0A1X0QC43_9MICR|nr:hypothetical protein HERIO_794 [Hepatospora eriocheir]